MANNNDMITLNIYNQPPPKSVDETGMNIIKQSKILT